MPEPRVFTGGEAVFTGGEFFARLSVTRAWWTKLVADGSLPKPPIMVGTEQYRNPKYVYTEAYLEAVERILKDRPWKTAKGRKLRKALTAAGVS